MASDNSSRFPAGRTALVIKVPEAEPLVGAWRQRFDPAMEAGVPAHVTVLYPFLDRERIDVREVEALEEVFGAHAAFDLSFHQCGRFPDLLYLAPEPTGGLRALTSAVADRWPEAPPYGGRYADVVPHLTVAYSPDPSVFNTIEADLTAGLPVVARVSSVQLVVSDGEKWHNAETFSLRG
ncbi:2'-5' RNA ligase family protein [Streptomyces sp. H10-C2]|uniref:2'-5' RNA ligase family protein n=1 Tax=unclassified Streptomyces TaxID=2593676 RepID=UPI0024BAE1DC|nr:MULTISPECIES: 2'-5' RNA ligase family protein [unclassified Streptomyces]MDJ0343617.1 2'-5' RNA ligase family protein [Streptomyces sp. PH10-H1]MDJ0373135.1 2'-5' RNA ligase family protein [Streptomyces sp. H10-C2]